MMMMMMMMALFCLSKRTPLLTHFLAHIYNQRPARADQALEHFDRMVGSAKLLPPTTRPPASPMALRLTAPPSWQRRSGSR